MGLVRTVVPDERFCSYDWSRTTVFLRKHRPIPIEANPMITIDPPSSLATALSTSTLTRFLNRARAAVGLHGAVDVLLADDPTLDRKSVV